MERYPPLPCDLLEEILQKLPIKSLVRFKSVLKQWKSTIESQDFVEKHMIRQKSEDPKILVSSRFGREFKGLNGAPLTTLSIGSISIAEEEEIYRSYALLGRLSVPFEVLVSCDGLVCIYGMMSIFVFNPATRDLRKLPAMRHDVHFDDLDPCTYRHMSVEWKDRLVGFGRDNVAGTYKVVRMHKWLDDSDERTECYVFPLNTGAWRYASPVPYHILPRQKPTYAYGSLHWLASQVRDHYRNQKILAFNLHTEKFRLIRHPSSCSSGHSDSDTILIHRMFSLRNRLCFSESRCRLNIWSMDPDERWEKIYSININNHISFCGAYGLFTPLAVCKKGRLVITDGERLFAYYPETESFRSMCRREGFMTPYFESLVSTFQ